jgi:uncharacterized protein YvpB
MTFLNSRLLSLISFLLLLLILVSLVYFFIIPPNIISPQIPLESPLDLSPQKPLVIKFDRPFSKKINAAITPKVPGTWNSTYSTLTFSPTVVLEDDAEYVISLTNILPYAWLFPSLSKNYLFILKTPPHALPQITESITFTPAPPPTPTPASETVSLAIPLYKQHYKFTCFTTAAKMALGFRKIEIDEVKFLDEIGYDKTKRNFVTNSWGNPNLGVVGTINGQGEGGYGAHWDPVAKAMSQHTRVEVKRNWTLAEMLTAVKAGNPVMVWWVNGVWPAKDISWNTSSGEKVYTVNGMHVEVVRGYSGTPENPEYIYTNDPWRGKRQYKPEVFKELWKWFENTAIIVY